MIKSHLLSLARAGPSLSAVVPPSSSADFLPHLASVAASILYKSPIPTRSGHALYVLNSAALPELDEAEFALLLPYLLARLPGEDDLIAGAEYEVIFFAGAGVGASKSPVVPDHDGSASSSSSSADSPQKKQRPSWSWLLSAYHLLSRAMRKRIQKLYIVHQRTWLRVLAEMFYTVVSPKFRKKIVYASSISALALHIPIEDVLIPASAYHYDRTLSDSIFAPYCTGCRAFAAPTPFPTSSQGTTRLPRLLRETSKFVLMPENVDGEGIFRVSPSVKTRSILKEAYDRGQKLIVWKGGNDAYLPLPRYPQADDTDALICELSLSETYDRDLAASLIKLWYSELSTPLLPQSCYTNFLRTFPENQATTRDLLVHFLCPTDDWSCMPRQSRQILTRHLLPLLHEVSKHQDSNKMTPENLAICFAPTLVRGDDQMADVKIAALLRGVLQHAIEAWPTLRDVFAIDENAFERDLLPPADMEEYEDPLYDKHPRPSSKYDSYAGQTTGFVPSLSEADSLNTEDPAPPQLPPRSFQPPIGLARITSENSLPLAIFPNPNASNFPASQKPFNVPRKPVASPTDTHHPTDT